MTDNDKAMIARAASTALAAVRADYDDPDECENHLYDVLELLGRAVDDDFSSWALKATAEERIIEIARRNGVEIQS